jgi:hypothetical protein
MLAQADVLYTTDARIVCAACFGKADIVETDKRAANNIRNAAVASLVAGLLSFVMPIFVGLIIEILFLALAFSSGLYALRSLMPGNERFSRHLTLGQRVGIWICAGIGLGLASLVTLALLGVIHILLSS